MSQKEKDDDALYGKSHVSRLDTGFYAAFLNTFGDEIKVVIEQDTDEREVAVPEDVANLLKEDHKSARFYESLSYTDKKEFMRWIENARQSDTRTRRITIFLEKMKAKKRFMDL